MMEEVSVDNKEEDARKEVNNDVSEMDNDCDQLSESLMRDDSVIVYDINNGLQCENVLEKNDELVEINISEVKTDQTSASEDSDSINIKSKSENQSLLESSIVDDELVENKNSEAKTNQTSGSEDSGSINISSKLANQNLLESSIVKVKVLENQNTELICENEDQRKVIEMLRIEVTKKDEELLAAENQVKSVKEGLEKKYNNMQEETMKKINDLQRAFDLAKKDKESMVMKYAMGEKDIMIAKRGKEDLEKKLRESMKDKESFQYKIKTLSNERTRLQGICDFRAQETISAKKEGDKWKEEVKAIEAKMNLSSSRLNTEVDAHRETKESLDTTFKQLIEVQGSIDDIRSECNEIINKNKVEEENLKKKEMNQEKEHSVKLMIDSVAAAELDSLRKKHRETVNENNELSIKVQNSEIKMLKCESSLSELKGTTAKQKTEIVDLYSKCSELESVRLQLAGEREKVDARDVEVTRLRAETVEMIADMASCRKKEGELLEFTQKLTEKNVNIQSEFSLVETRAAYLEEEHAKIVANLARAETKLSKVVGQLEVETSKRQEETEMLARKLAERVRAVEVANQQVIDTNNDLDVEKRRNMVRVKELTKELNLTKKKMDSLEKGGGRESSPGLSTSSRCSSSNSLHKELETVELSPGTGHSTTSLVVQHNSQLSKKVSQTSLQDAGQPDTRHREVSGGSVGQLDLRGSSNSLQLADTQQLLVEKIVKLQRACARRQEKLDLLEEHVEQLMNEIKKKNRLIQNYFMGLETGALVSEESDIHKHTLAVIMQDKATVGGGQGIMASLYSSRVSDAGLTLELSLEINKKLQAVLEDTLLKNITLKENINTLGQEISKMAMTKQRAAQ
eukprot:GFUD01044027.1.p1 GENE.GFUD01044027.1~~GFUD01044027.1.p1  ORF type:complete len:857 (+),score=378.83 GFUD01044027.1:68-2638(+)